MKKLLAILLLAFSVNGFTQELIILDFWEFRFGFEDPIEYQYVKIIDNEIWQIGRPNKNILFLDNDKPYLGEMAIITDTVEYYPNDTIVSFQFRIYLENEGETEFRFSHKYDFEENKDGGILETSYDNGVTWQNVLFDTLIQNNLTYSQNFYDEDDTIKSYDHQPGFTGLQSDLSNVILRFNMNGNYGDTLLLKYTMATDDNDDQNEGWMLDDFLFFSSVVNVKTVDQNPGIRVFPNPMSDLLMISCEHSTITDVVIFSLNGTKLLSHSSTSMNCIDISGLQPGIYMVLLSDKKTKWITKILKL
ncbi:MAG: T9SS type A sorting domain-containing protein [Bacteroidales bacterium]|nr:T9SS type A sorting domain-containing protein [Bacteroidales bacterium]